MRPYFTDYQTRHVDAKDHKKTHVRTEENKDPYLRSITYIYTHTLPMYVSKANIFILLTSANYGSMVSIDFTNTHTHTRANNPIFIQLATTVFSTKAART